MDLEVFLSLPIWNVVYFGNTVGAYAIAGAIFVGFLVVLGVIRGFLFVKLSKLAQKTKTDIDDLFISILRSVRPPFFVILSLYLGFLFIEVPVLLDRVVMAVVLIWVTYQIIVAVQLVIDYVIKRRIDPGEGNQQAALDLLSTVSKIILWVLGALLVLQNLGINVTSFIAGLGIGGIAVALALQNILGDLFSSFAIYFDKPFTVGDFIVVGDKMGTVEKIGIKTTRLRALQGEEIVLANAELTSAQVQNFKRMEERRIAFSVGVTYDTPSEKLRAIPDIVKEVIDPLGLARFGRAHFKAFGDSALLYEIVYFTTSPEYDDYMDVQQDINLRIIEAFRKERIEMAFPTQTVYVHKES